MAERELKYDVAFSFLSEDEGVTMQINDLLQDRYKTFIYSEKQKWLAGKDGELTFNRVFSRETRTVAVLYRLKWGTTPWTRIEETAIRNRARDEGYDFATFIAMTDPIEKPPWLPKTRLLYGLKRFGVEGAAIVLDARVQEQGGGKSEETVIQRAERLRRAEQFYEQASYFRKSELGVEAAKAARDQFVEDAIQQIASLKDTGVGLTSRGNRSGFEIFSGRIVVAVIHWRCQYMNSLDGSKLHVEFFKGFPSGIPGTIPPYEDAPLLERFKFEFRLIGPDRPAWTSENFQIAPADMGAWFIKRLMDHEQKRQHKRAGEN